MIERALKPKKCRQCGVVFTPIRSMQKVCSPGCAVALAEKEKARKLAQSKREERKSIREALEKSKTRGTHLRELQSAFNAWIRERDAGRPCISCGRYHDGLWHAGHYRSVGSAPELRFEPLNVHRQCAPCNLYLSGNLTAYRANLVLKIGLEKVEWLEGKHEPVKLTLPQIEQMKIYYRAEVRRMRKEAA
jgi:hypothetical protein